MPYNKPSFFCKRNWLWCWYLSSTPLHAWVLHNTFFKELYPRHAQHSPKCLWSRQHSSEVVLQAPSDKPSPFRRGLEPEAWGEPVLARVTWKPVVGYPFQRDEDKQQSHANQSVQRETQPVCDSSREKANQSINQPNFQ